MIEVPVETRFRGELWFLSALSVLSTTERVTTLYGDQGYRGDDRWDIHEDGPY